MNKTNTTPHPYIDRNVAVVVNDDGGDDERNTTFIREFDSSTIDPDDLIWHLDQKDRTIEVIEGNSSNDNEIGLSGWFLQMDNENPFLLKRGKTYHIPSMVYHRLLLISPTNNTNDNNKLILKISE